MGLGRFRVGAAVAVSDMDRARAFYEGVLGLSPATDHEPPDNVQYVCGESSRLHVFLSPQAGTAKSTLAGWEVGDVEAAVDDLVVAGVRFERYDEGPIRTDAKGIAHFDGGNKVAYFADPDGNLLSIAGR